MNARSTNGFGSGHWLSGIMRWALGLMVVLTTGCAELNWNRAIYQGMKFSAEHCEIKQRVDTPPCASLPSREQYERERDALKPAS